MKPEGTVLLRPVMGAVIPSGSSSCAVTPVNSSMVSASSYLIRGLHVWEQALSLNPHTTKAMLQAALLSSSVMGHVEYLSVKPGVGS